MKASKNVLAAVARADKVTETRVNAIALGAALPLTCEVADALSEEQFQRMVIDLARACGWRVAHFRRVRVQRKNGSVYWETPAAADGTGFPDLILIRGVVILAVELKVGTNKPTPEQLAWLAAFDGAHVQAPVWYPKDWDRIVEVLT